MTPRHVRQCDARWSAMYVGGRDQDGTYGTAYKHGTDGTGHVAQDTYPPCDGTFPIKGHIMASRAEIGSDPSQDCPESTPFRAVSTRFWPESMEGGTWSGPQNDPETGYLRGSAGFWDPESSPWGLGPGSIPRVQDGPS